MNKDNIFELAKSFDLTSYLQDIGLLVEEKKNNECPFCGKKNKFGIFIGKDGRKAFQCWSSECSKAGDIINFVEEYYKISPLEAAKKICVDNGIGIEDFDTDKYKAKLEENRLKAEELAKKEANVRYQRESRAAALMSPLFKTLHQRSKVASDKVEIQKVFPYYDLMPQNAKKYIGYDAEHQSVVVANLEGEKVHNIKHHHKKDMEGKWLSFPNSRVRPFLIDEYKKTSDYVFLVEGEKDALHLLSIGINVLTLGGVGLKWENYKELLRNKKIILFFDHDKAGYLNMIYKSLELKDIAREIFVVPFFFLGNNLKNGYDVSDYIKDKNIFTSTDSEAMKKVFFDKIFFAISKATGKILLEIAEFIHEENKIQPLLIKHGLLDNLEFDSIKSKWKNSVVRVKGEIEQDFDVLMESMKELGNSNKEEFQPIIEALQTLNPRTRVDFKSVFEFKTRLVKMYKQQHPADVARAVIEMAEESGYFLKEFKDELYAWSGKHFLKVPDKQLIKFVSLEWANQSGYQLKSRTASNYKELVDNIKDNIDSMDFKVERLKNRVLNLKNGVLEIDKRGNVHFSQQHNPDFMPTYLLDFDYNPNAKCPKWDKFLNSVLEDSKEADCLGEYMGYCLLPTHIFESFMMLVGEGGSGKSTIINMFRNFFQPEKISSLQMQQFYGHQLDAITDKIINIGAELDFRNMKDGQFDVLKSLVSARDEITIDPKHAKSYTISKPRQPKLIFAGNKKPTNVGDDSGIFRRLLMITFNNAVKNEDKVLDLSERFNDELDGILNWALRGLERLLKNQEFSKSERMLSDIEEYKDEQNPMRGFVKECVGKPEVSEGISIEPTYKKHSVYDTYRKWCKFKGSNALSDRKFWKTFEGECKSMGVNVTYTRVSDIRMVTGLVLIQPEGTNEGADDG